MMKTITREMIIAAAPSANSTRTGLTVRYLNEWAAQFGVNTDLRMAHEALLTQEASANDAMTDIGLCAEALDPWGVTLVDADVMQHRRLLQELRIQAQLGMLPGYQQATVCHLSAVG
jgi:hypothetical protein